MLHVMNSHAQKRQPKYLWKDNESSQKYKTIKKDEHAEQW